MARVCVLILFNLKLTVAPVADESLVHLGGDRRVRRRQASGTGGLDHGAGLTAHKYGLIGEHICAGKRNRPDIRDRIAVPVILAPCVLQLKRDVNALFLNSLGDIQLHRSTSKLTVPYYTQFILPCQAKCDFQQIFPLTGWRRSPACRARSAAPRWSGCAAP